MLAEFYYVVAQQIQVLVFCSNRAYLQQCCKTHIEHEEYIEPYTISKNWSESSYRMYMEKRHSLCLAGG